MKKKLKIRGKLELVLLLVFVIAGGKISGDFFSYGKELFGVAGQIFFIGIWAGTILIWMDQFLNNFKVSYKADSTQMEDKDD